MIGRILRHDLAWIVPFILVLQLWSDGSEAALSSAASLATIGVCLAIPRLISRAVQYVCSNPRQAKPFVDGESAESAGNTEIR